MSAINSWDPKQLIELIVWHFCPALLPGTFSRQLIEFIVNYGVLINCTPWYFGPALKTPRPTINSQGPSQLIPELIALIVLPFFGPFELIDASKNIGHRGMAV